MHIKKTKVWKFFSSIKLTIWLLTVISLFSLIGTFIPQNREAASYVDKYGHAFYHVLLKAGLTNIYTSWWFILCLILFSLNLAVCLLNKFSLKSRSLGSSISHLSILVILLGTLIGAVYGQKGLIRINKGEEIDSFMARDKKIDLGFSIRLNDFIYTEHISPEEKLLVYSVNTDTLIAQIPVEIGIESDVVDTGCKVKTLRYLPDFVIDSSTKVASTRSNRPNNPAIEVELKDKDGRIKTFWVFARFPDMHQAPDPNLRFAYNWAYRRPKDFVSRVTILKDGKEVVSRDIRVNKPLRFEGYSFFQFTYDQEGLRWSGLQVVKDPGVSVVYLGFILLISGLMIIFYINPLIKGRSNRT